MGVVSLASVDFMPPEEPIPDTERAPKQSLIVTEDDIIDHGITFSMTGESPSISHMARVAVARALGFTFGGFAWVRTAETDTRVGRVWS
jgi:hypothetical protein